MGWHSSLEPYLQNCLGSGSVLLGMSLNRYVACGYMEHVGAEHLIGKTRAEATEGMDE